MKRYYDLECGCGAPLRVRSDLMHKPVHRCRRCAGAANATKSHGRTDSPEYQVWSSMKSRCNNPRHRQYADYGGRGITVCSRWSTFENFLEDMGERPSPKHTLDRLDNNAGYGPDNCAWRLHAEQQRNKRNNRLLTLGGETRTLSEWVEKTGVPQSTLTNRLRRGWSVEATLTTPRKRKP